MCSVICRLALVVYVCVYIYVAMVVFAEYNVLVYIDNIVFVSVYAINASHVLGVIYLIRTY